MPKQVCTLCLIVGALLLLCGAALFLHAGAIASHPDALQRVLVQRVLDQQATCMSCHDSHAETVSLVVLNVSPRYEHTQTTRVSPPITDQNELQASFDNRLQQLGKRIVDAPASDPTLYAALAQEFVSIHTAARHTVNPAALSRMGLTLDKLEQAILILENQAQPVRIKQVGEKPVRQRAAALHSGSFAPSFAVHVNPITIKLALAYHFRQEDSTLLTPSPAVRVSHRRGPPTNPSFDSMCSGRLLSRDMPSPFVFGDSSRLSMA